VRSPTAGSAPARASAASAEREGLPLEWAIGGKVRHVLSDDLDDLKSSIEKIARS
jgi:hypothetical protein